MCVVSQCQPTCFPEGTEADKRRDPVDASGAWAARGSGTVIDVFRAVWSTPAINAHADVAANQVATSAAVLTSVWLQSTFVHILCTVLT